MSDQPQWPGNQSQGAGARPNSWGAPHPQGPFPPGPGHRPGASSAPGAGWATPKPPDRKWYQKKRFLIPAVLLGIPAALFILLFLLALILPSDDNATPNQRPAAASASSSESDPSASDPAGSSDSASQQSEAGAETQSTPAAQAADYPELTPRDFKLLAKDPDSFKGKTYTIYGHVTQFDAATGRDAFRANTGPNSVPADSWYEFEQNTVLGGEEATFADLVQDDLFKAKVSVTGAFSYDTQIGGSTVVPSFYVNEIEVYDSVE